MKCAYCNEDKYKLTREHVIPDCFLKGMNRKATTAWLDKAPKRVIKGDIVIKDVCEKCNNEDLSTLDNYAYKFITSYNGKINHNIKKIFFKYNFNMLSRWLLKVVYNSARTNNSKYDCGLYSNYAKYIIKNEDCPLDFSLFVQYIDLSIQKSDKHEYYHFDSQNMYKIDHFRIGPSRLKDLSTYYCSIRTVIINSFVFFIVVYDTRCTNEDKKSIEQYIIKHNSCAVKIQKSSKKIKLNKDKTFWRNSLLSNLYLHDNFLEERKEEYNEELLIITLSKEEIETQDYNQINHFIVSKAESKDDIMEYLQRFEICVDGYDKDPRELYEIPEFQVYACELIDSFPEIIWFLNLKAGFFPALAASYFNYYRKTVDKPLVEFMLKCFGPLNLMTNQFAIDNSYNSQVTDIFTNRLQELFVK